MKSFDYEKLDTCISLAQEYLWASRLNSGAWDFRAHLGSHFFSQYSLCLNWLDILETRMDRENHKSSLIENQRRDGGWSQLSTDIESELNASIFNYWYLKSIGTPLEHPTLKSARQFILSKGGLEKSALFTHFFMALFGVVDWSSISYVPYSLFLEKSPINYKAFSQWVIPHLMPMGYLRANQVMRNLNSKFQLDELKADTHRQKAKTNPFFTAVSHLEFLSKAGRRWTNDLLIEKIRRLQQPQGSWGGYTVSTLMTMMCFKHFCNFDLSSNKKLESAFYLGQSFIEKLYFAPGTELTPGCLMDGHYWDTLLVANSLMASGDSKTPLQLTAKYIVDTQQAEGGFPYGYDFEYAPDVDDTAEAILFLHNYPSYHEHCDRAGKWLLKMQNRGGGWGAFDRNNDGNWLLKKFTKAFQDSVDLFDDSSADSTGHVLDALALLGYNQKNSGSIRKGISYLLECQEKNNLWTGRWAINYLFGSSCAIVGMIHAGVSVEHPQLKSAIDKLITLQNLDGGYGETTKSYLSMDFAKGPSTPSQSAWILWVLTEAELEKSPTAMRIVEYLSNSLDTKAKTWIDPLVTGTGHPGLLYMIYPSYAKAFPLYALGNWKAKNSKRI